MKKIPILFPWSGQAIGHVEITDERFDWLSSLMRQGLELTPSFDSGGKLIGFYVPDAVPMRGVKEMRLGKVIIKGS